MTNCIELSHAVPIVPTVAPAAVAPDPGRPVDPDEFRRLLDRSVAWRRWLERRWSWRVPDAAAEIVAAMWEQCAVGGIDDDRCFRAARVALTRSWRRELRFAGAPAALAARTSLGTVDDDACSRVVERVSAVAALDGLAVPPGATRWAVATSAGERVDRAATVRGRRWADRARATLVARGVDAA